MSKKKSLLIIFLAAIVTMVFIGCEKKEPDLTGKWIMESDENYSIELFSDKTGIMYGLNEGGEDTSYSIEWIAEDGRIKFSIYNGNASVSYAYEINDDKLILQDDNGEQLNYFRK